MYRKEEKATQAHHVSPLEIRDIYHDELEHSPNKHKKEKLITCCLRCELCSCVTIFLFTFLSLVFTGLTQVNYRFNIGASVAKAALNPIFALLLLFSVVFHLLRHLQWNCCYRTTEGPCDNCNSNHRRAVLLLLLLNFIFVLIPILGVTTTTGAWLGRGAIGRIFGHPSSHAKSLFRRPDGQPYSFTDHMFWWCLKQYNPILSSNNIKTATHVFKNITETAPYPNGDALSFTTATADSRINYLELDLYHPKSVRGDRARSSRPAPVIVHVHGGAFVLGDKSLSAQPFASYQEQGYAVVSIQYRLAPFGWNGWDIATDLVDAMLWIQDNANVLDIDPDQIVMAGESAGGFASSYVCYLFSAKTSSDVHTFAPGVNGKERSARIQEMSSRHSIKGCVNFYGALEIQDFLDKKVANWDMVETKVPDLVRVMLTKHRKDTNRTSSSSSSGVDPKQESKEWRTLLKDYGIEFSCSRLVTATSPPTLSFHGASDVVVPPQMSISLHDALDKANITNALSILGLSGHTYDIGEYSAGGQVGWYAMERFLAAVMPV